MKHIVIAFFTLSFLCAFISGLTVGLTGCPAVFTALPEVIAAIGGAAQIVDSIESFVSTYFLSHPNLEEQKKVSAVIIKCRMALNEALFIARGAKDLNDQKVDQAFEEFKQAYIELLKITQVYGVKAAQGNRLLQASPETLTVPDAASVSRYAKGAK